MNTNSTTIIVKVFANSIEPKVFEWPGSTLVGDAAIEATRKFEAGFDEPTFENEDDQVLDRTVTLAQAGVECGALLELVSIGGGV